MSDNSPTPVVQQSLDVIGSAHLLGDIEDGTRESQILLRAYRQCVRQLLRSAHWDWARRIAPLQLLADASGNTPNVGTLVVDPQFNYEYALPTDCEKVRYIPQNPWGQPGIPSNNIMVPNPTSPTMTGIGQPPYGPRRIRPARFIISNDPNYPPEQGTNWIDLQGVSPQGRTVILTNVQGAKLIYTYLCLYPSVWDSLFRAALVAFIASEVALAILPDKKFALEMRKEQIGVAKDKIIQARAASGNEGTQSADIPVDWMNTRYVRNGFGWGYGWGDAGGFGDLWGGMDDCCGAGVVSGAAF